MTPADFLNEVALPTVLDFRGHRRSRRHAYLACIVTFHVTDHLKAVGETGIESAMRGVTGPFFDEIRGVCNGTKHVKADTSHSIEFAIGDDLDRLPAFAGVMRMGRSFFGDKKGGRDIKAGTGRADLYTACSTVLRAYVTTYPQQFTGCDVSGL